jgi:CheY-like chemotaxis protein
VLHPLEICARGQRMGRILVVDDDPDFLEIMRTILLADDHEVLTASSGDEAVSRMHSTVPDLVLLDMMMSHVLEGSDVMRQMWQDSALRSIPVIVVSSLAATREAEMFSPEDHVSMVDWISKPVRPDALRERVRRLLAQGQSGP